MDNDSKKFWNDWQLVCTFFMIFATGAVIYGSLPSLVGLSGSNDFNLQSFFHATVWVYGLLGVSLCYLEDAVFKNWLATFNFTWSAILLLWTLILDVASKIETPATYPFNPDGNTLFLLICFASWAALYVHDKRKLREPEKSNNIAEWLVHFLIFNWLAVPVLIWRFIFAK
jgi:hypothetical protein